MNIKDFFQSVMFKRILFGIGVLVLALLIFQAGLFVGFHKADFSYRFGDNYYRNFEGRRGELMGMPKADFPNAHGAAGKVVKVSLPTLVVQDRDGIEKIILIKADTSIKKFKDDIKSAEIKVDDFVVVVGEPNDKSQIEAKLIRLLPPPTEDMLPPLIPGALLPPADLNPVNPVTPPASPAKTPTIPAQTPAAPTPIK